MNFHNIITSIQMSLETKNWYSAMFLSLAIPDICGNIDYPGTPSGQRYCKWFNQYLASKYNPIPAETTYMTAEDCFALRCAMYHEGKTDITSSKKKTTLDNFLFIATGKQFVWHCSKIANNQLTINIDIFCEDMIQAFMEWMNDNRADDGKMANITSTLHIRDLSAHSAPELFNFFFNGQDIPK